MKAKSVPPSPRRLKYKEEEKLFTVAEKHAREAVHGIALQFYERLTEDEIFALTWNDWDGIFLIIDEPAICSNRVIRTNFGVMIYLQDASISARGFSVMTISREDYRKALQDVWKRARVPGPAWTPSAMPVDAYYQVR